VKRGVGKTTVEYTFFVGEGGGIRPHTGGLQTTKKWEADKHAKCRLSADGRVRRKKGSVGCVSLMTQHHTNYVVSLMTT
jgi:hypothetical protein